MKLIVISTTINGEKNYLPFDRLLAKSKFSNAMFVIAGDRNAALFDTSSFRSYIEYLDPKDQKRFNSSEVIGWNTPRRRPIAWLRAMELKPDFILSVDDDNIPPEDYFDRWHDVLAVPIRKVVSAMNTAEPVWHNYLATSDSPIEIYPRGFPVPFRGKLLTKVMPAEKEISVDKVGVFQGISLGDPDIDAMTRIVYPKPLPLNSISEKNYALRDVWSPYNMQNTMFTKKIFGLPILWPFAGRFDDIYASFAWQKLLFNNGMYTHVGEPINRQDRGTRDVLNTDLKEETEGYFHSHEVWQRINEISEREPAAFLEKLIQSDHDIIRRHREFFIAYLKDVEKAMS